MNILYTFLNFNGLTGSELYYYELAREMVNLGHNVTISSNCGGEIKYRAEKNGIKCINMADTEINSIRNNFDIIHLSHKPVASGLAPIFTNSLTFPAKPSSPKFVATIHSEVLDIEDVVKTELRFFIDRYILVRGSIFGVINTLRKKHLIYNPIDFSRFNEKNTSDEGYILFPGSLNYLRKNVLLNVMHEFPNREILVIGRNDYPDLKLKNVRFMDPVWNIEDYIKKAHMVIGILRGRTFYEALLCGKQQIDFTVDKEGNILHDEFYQGNYFGFDKNEVDSILVALKIEKIYKELI